MKEIRVRASSEYSVYVGEGVLERLGELAAATVSGRKAMLVCGSTVSGLYADQAERILQASGFSVSRFVYPAGEQSKTVECLSELLEAAAGEELDREDVFLALGGGVTGDLTGLAAALYKRGVACIQIPTTILASVDSSVGGKTAVNLKAGKNLCGVFQQPAAVLCDTKCLATLPPRIVSEGWAEIIKYAFLDRKIYEMIRAGASLEEIICACLACKSELTAADEFDRGQRRLLNFGHTVGHAAEWCSGYALLHGEAVAAGMGIMTRGCEKLGLCRSEISGELENLLREHGLPVSCAFSAEELLRASTEDKKRSGDSIYLVIPQEIGRCTVEKHSLQTLEKIIHAGI